MNPLLDRNKRVYGEVWSGATSSSMCISLRNPWANTLQELKRDEEATVAYERAQRVAPHLIFAIHCILAGILLKKEAQGEPSGEKPDRQPNAPRRGRRAKSREAVRDEETQRVPTKTRCILKSVQRSTVRMAFLYVLIACGDLFLRLGKASDEPYQTLAPLKLRRGYLLGMNYYMLTQLQNAVLAIQVMSEH